MKMIKTILKKSFEWKESKKDLFMLSFFTQFIYLAVAVYFIVVSFLQIMEHSNYIMDKFSSLTPEQVALGMADNPLAIYSRYSSLITSVVFLIILSYLAYLVLNGTSWSIANKIVNAKQKFFRFFPKYIAFTLVFTLPLLAVLWFFTRFAAVTGLSTLFMTLFGVVALVFWYFMMVSFSLIHNYWVWDFKYHFIRTFVVGVKKSGTLVPIGLLNLAVLCLLGLLVYKTADNFIPLVIAIALFILASVQARILFMTAVHEVSEGRILKGRKTVLKM